MATPELRHMLRDDDLNHEEQKQVLELAIKFHKNRFYHQPFAGPQGIAVIFDKPSTRTRSSFSIGVAELGGYPLVIDKSGSQLGRGEPVADTARVLDRMAYGVIVAHLWSGPCCGNGQVLHPSGGERTDRRIPSVPDSC